MGADETDSDETGGMTKTQKKLAAKVNAENNKKKRFWQK
jgi:hypothetical protein